MRGADLGAGVAKHAVRFGLNVRGLQRFREARPASARIELVERTEERLAGYDIDIDAGFVIIPVRVTERSLRRFVLCDLVLKRGEFFLEVGIAGFHKGFP